MFNKYDITITW